MYEFALKDSAIARMKEEATRLRKEYLEYAEDMELFANPEFWKAVQQVESGKTRKMSVKQLKARLGIGR